MEMPRVILFLFALVICAVVLAISDPANSLVQSERLSLDEGWRFHLGDIPNPEIVGHDATYMSAPGAAAADYDDTAWRPVDLPHDWAVEGPFDPSANVSQGYRPRGIGWYRRHFRLAPQDRGKHLEIQLDGIATHATIWLNGTLIHRNWCGYTSVYMDITPLALYGDALNTLVVRVDAEAMEGWWYEGAGIYRHTWLIKSNPVHIISDGVHADPVRDSSGKWSLPIEVTLDNIGPAAEAEVRVKLLDPSGHEIGTTHSTVTVESLEQAVATLAMAVENPVLWSVEHPNLYSVQTQVFVGGKQVDAKTTHCGFRTLRFDANHGFFLNGQPLKLQGVCNHQDHAGVGVAVPDSLWDFRIRRLKEMGVNAYRCAHNPPAAEFLDACDRLGMLVMDENRVFNTSPEYQRQLEWLVRRDRNHPSVILWSVFNEEPMQGSEAGYEMVRRMAHLVKRLDKNRPVTAAMNGGLFTPLNVSKAVDVVGFNYQIPSYDAFHEANPNLPMTSSEDTSAFMTRGEYVTDDSKHIKDGFDTQFAPWGNSHRDAWKAIATRPYLAGGFVWTGFDYRGEPTPFQWPSVGSYFGIMDLCGFAKPAFYMHQAQWVHDRPILQIEPHWNWPGHEGKPVRVMAISNADTVSLSLNGVDLGEKPVDPYEMVDWQVPYQPGKLEAVAKKAGCEVARQVVETTGEPVSLKLTPDRSVIAGDGCDAVPVTVEALDAEGRHVPTANLMVEFEISGPGEIIGLGNGDPVSHEPEKGNKRSLFNGLAQMILRSHHHGSGSLVLRAKATGLQSAEVSIQVEKVAEQPAIPVAHPVLALDHWRMSPISATPPDPNQKLADSDQNSWERIHPGKLQIMTGGRYTVYRTHLRPFAAVQARGGKVVFRGISGHAEFWLDGVKVAAKTDSVDALFELALPAGSGERTISILVQQDEGGRVGLSASAFVVGNED